MSLLAFTQLRYFYRKVFAPFLCFPIFLSLMGNPSFCQIKLQGTVYDETGVFPLHAVSISCSSGSGTISDSTGHYLLFVGEKDSVWFSYLGKETKKFSIDEIPDLNDFNISIKINFQVLKEVKVRPPDYKLDSIQNRIDYAKVFNYQKPSFRSIVTSIGLGFTVDLDELIRAFQYRKKKMMIGFQKRLLNDEQEKYISHRFNKLLVSELTGLHGEILDSFMVKYRPSYEFTTEASDYTLRKYIKDMKDIYVSEILQIEKPSEKENAN